MAGWIERCKLALPITTKLQAGDLVACDFFQTGQVSVHLIAGVQHPAVTGSRYAFTVMPWYEAGTRKLCDIEGVLDAAWFLSVTALTDFEQKQLLDPAGLLGQAETTNKVSV